MSHPDDARLADLADAIYGITRQLPLPTDPAFVSCTPVEINVMRAINRSPGLSARDVSEATLLPSSNLSRVLRGLEARGLVARQIDERDARMVRLFPTERAQASTAALHDTWADALAGTINDDAELERIVQALRRLEAELIARRRPAR